jgi:hypothetical protein
MSEHLVYPTNEQLEMIRKWPYVDFQGLMNFVKALWKYGDNGFWKDWENKNGDHVYRLATAGWSGNEDIIRAMGENYIFWSMCWELSAKGGLHIFILSKLKTRGYEEEGTKR